jgi:fatty-acyl-CoA synthase
VIIKAGRNLYPAEIEELSAQVPGVRKGCVIAFSIIDSEHGTEKLIVVAETQEKKPRHPHDIIGHIVEKIVTALDVAPDQVVLVPPHTIPKTSSGKLQRSACKASYLSGKLEKHRLPLWIQLTKIGAKVGWITIKNKIADVIKFIYTCYIAILVCSTLIPIYICLLTLPKYIVAPICKYWARCIFLLAFCPLSIRGKKNIYTHHPFIFASNHVSYADALLLLAILPAGTHFIGKQELTKTFIFRPFIYKLNYLTIDRVDATKGIEDTKLMEQMVRDKNSITIFPEGTFSYAAGLRPFKLGAFKIAADTGTPICPIAINGTRSILRGEERLLKPGHIKIIICEAIFASGKEWNDIIRLKNQVREQIVKYCGEPSLDFIASTLPGEQNVKP